MAKKRKTPAQPGQDWNVPAAELLAELPTDRDELLAAAVAAVVEIDAAIMRGDGAAAEAASDRYEAVIWKMNGGTHVGSMADHDAPGQVIERHCAAVPGDVPLWGQRGQFLVADGDMRALVEYEAGYGWPLGAHFQFHVIDLDRPFISETGYRSHFDTARGCMTVAHHRHRRRGAAALGAHACRGAGRERLVRCGGDPHHHDRAHQLRLSDLRHHHRPRDDGGPRPDSEVRVHGDPAQQREHRPRHRRHDDPHPRRTGWRHRRAHQHGAIAGSGGTASHCPRACPRAEHADDLRVPDRVR